MQCSPSVLQALPAGEKVRLVEIGSGSGGTSVVVMEALAEYAEHVELTYTDISPQLVAYGRKRYGKQYPFVRFHVLDVEKDVVPQVSSLRRHSSCVLIVGFVRQCSM